MSDYYVDHGAYATNIGATPTWGTPQEGDGSALAAASAAGTAAIVFTANAAATNTVSICGVTFTAMASGATGNQFNVGGSLTATLDNLVAAINASSTAVGSGVAVGVPQLRNLVFARNTSGTTLEVMMRIGSTTLNGATNTNCRLTTASWATSTTLPVNFAGGSGGCWGWLLNTAAIGVSNSIAVLTYGLLFAQPYVWTGTPTINDIVWCRSGSGKTLTYSAATASISRSQSWPLRMVIDTNTKWTGDSGTGVVLIDITMTGSSSGTNLYFAATASVEVVIGALMRGGGKLKLTCTGTSSNFNVGGGSTGNNTLVLSNIDVEDGTTQTTSGVIFGQSGSGVMTVRGMRFSRPVAASALRQIVVASSGFTTFQRFEQCKFTWNITGVSDPGQILNLASTSNGLSLVFSGCGFEGWPSGNDKFTLVSGSSSTTAAVSVVAENCTGLKLSSTYSGLVSTVGVATTNPATAGFLMQSGEPGSPYRLEYRNGITEYDPDTVPAYPLLSALQADGTTRWSLKAIWFNNGEVTGCNDFRACDLSLVSRMSAATRTITLELFMRTTLAAALDHLKVLMVVTYISNTTGKVVTELLNAVPSTSTASWAGAGSWSGYDAYKLQLTTADPIKVGTLISVALRLAGRPNTGQNEVMFIDSEFGVT